MKAGLAALALAAAVVVLGAAACGSPGGTASSVSPPSDVSAASSPAPAGAPAVWPTPGSLGQDQAAQALRDTTTFGDGIFARYTAHGRESKPRGVRVILVPDENGGLAYRVQWNDWTGGGWSRGRDVADVGGVFADTLKRPDTEYVGAQGVVAGARGR